MQLKLYRDYAKKRNSTAIPGSGVTVDTFDNVRVKQPCSTLNPVFLVTASYGVNYTYAHFKGRYYFITDIVSATNNIIEVHCAVDALATYRNYIGSYTAYVERCASSTYYDPMLIDPLIARSTDIYQINRITKDTGLGDSETYFMRTVSGKGIMTYCTPIPGELTDVMFPQTGESNWDQIRNDMWIATYNPSQYLLDYYMLPIPWANISGLSDPTSIDWGFHNASMYIEIGGSTVRRSVSIVSGRAGATITITNISIPPSGYYDFRRFDPTWSKYYIWLPFFGLNEIPAQYADQTLEAVYDIDALSGECMVRLRVTEDEGAPIMQLNSNIKVQMQISSVNTDWQTFASSAAGSFSDALTLNFGGMVNDIWNEQKAINQPLVNVVGNPSGNGYVSKMHDNITTFAISYKSKDIPTSKAGRPCCQNLQLSSLAGSGFVKCTGSSISIPGTDMEKDMINAYLNGGFYME